MPTIAWFHCILIVTFTVYSARAYYHGRLKAVENYNNFLAQNQTKQTSSVKYIVLLHIMLK